MLSSVLNGDWSNSVSGRQFANGTPECPMPLIPSFPHWHRTTNLPFISNHPIHLIIQIALPAVPTWWLSAVISGLLWIYHLDLATNCTAQLRQCLRWLVWQRLFTAVPAHALSTPPLQDLSTSPLAAVPGRNIPRCQDFVSRRHLSWRSWQCPEDLLSYCYRDRMF